MPILVKYNQKRLFFKKCKKIPNMNFFGHNPVNMHSNMKKNSLKNLMEKSYETKPKTY